MSSSTLASFKSVIFNYYKSALVVSYDCEDPRSFKSIMVLVQYRVVRSCSISCLGVFLNISCLLLLLLLVVVVVVHGPAVIGHSCCGVPAVLSVCLFVCLFFGEACKIKKIK